jgi:hypothetical protein
MTLSARVMLSSVVLAFATFVTTPAQAQTMPASVIHPESPRRFEGYYSYYRFDRPGDRLGMNGIGARFLWRPAVTNYTTSTLPSRLSFGLFGEYVPDQAKGFSVGHAGVQSDLNVLATPLYGRVSPLVSLGAGVLWTDRVGPAIDSREFTLGNRSVSMFALAPAVGTRVGIWRQLGLRADARDLITFRDRTLHHVQLAAGLSLPF